MIEKGAKVRVVRLKSDTIEEYDPLVYEHTSCFLGQVGTVKTEPVWLDYEPEKGPLGQVIAKGECWVEFDYRCGRHGETGAVFRVDELEKVE